VGAGKQKQKNKEKLLRSSGGKIMFKYLFTALHPIIKDKVQTFFFFRLPPLSWCDRFFLHHRYKIKGSKNFSCAANTDSHN
jgi:hypothetical protein